METLRAVKGMNDLFEDELATWRRVEEAARRTCSAFGYGEIRTPILEETALFVRGVGEETDIVTKEMYAFADGDKSVCLRPENTAGVVRAMVEHGKLPADADERVFYVGPMFRRERPQKGRYRQFHQLGAEALGFSSASVDVEMMAMIAAFLDALGVTGVKLLVNTLGDAAERGPYADALRAYFGQHEAELSEDSKRRLTTNVLRILDSKDPKDRALAQGAPRTLDHLGDASRAHFDAVTNGLARLGIPFVVEPTLVRGLDYYTRTVFEVVAEAGLGAQNTVAAGGRYDGLVQTLGGRPTPAVGFAAGIERLVLLLQDAGKAANATGPELYLIGADDDGRASAERLAYGLRRRGVRVEIDHRGRSVKAQMRGADRSAARFTMVLGSREIAGGAADLKRMAGGDVSRVALDVDALDVAMKGIA
jgi:histidyl-tRNA synthetase